MNFNNLCTAVIYNETYSFYTETLLMMHQTVLKTTSIKLQTENNSFFLKMRQITYTYKRDIINPYIPQALVSYMGHPY